MKPIALTSEPLKPVSFVLPPKFKTVAKLIAGAANTAINDYANEVITDEPTITDRWIGAVVGVLNQAATRRRTGIWWRAKTLRASSGAGAEESRHGADILGVTEIHTGGCVVRKGFLGQAKRTEPRKELSKAEWERLTAQTKLMLERSPTSFVLTYSRREGIRFVPAIAINHLGQRALLEFNSISLQQFFEWHFSCFIGDQFLSAPNIETLDDILAIHALQEFAPRHVLHIVLSYE